MSNNFKLITMKTLKKITMIIVLALIISALLYGCSTKTYNEMDVSVVSDKSEVGFIAKPDSAEIKNLFPFKDSIWNGFRFRTFPLTDVDYNPAYTTEIASEFQIVSNNYTRKDRVKDFLSGVDKAIEKLNSVPVGRPNSCIYVPIATELNRLSLSNAKRRILIVYSDFMEFSTLADFYKKSTLETIKSNPDSIQGILENRIQLSNLSGIEVYIIYQPRNLVENNQYTIVTAFWKAMLEKKGAKVTISANLII